MLSFSLVSEKIDISGTRVSNNELTEAGVETLAFFIWRPSNNVIFIVHSVPPSLEKVMFWISFESKFSFMR